MSGLTLISHHLCPYVQRAAISLYEKEVKFERIYVDLANKPDWFKELSPLGKVPVLKLGAPDSCVTIFESAVILEFLEETQPHPLHPDDAFQRARHRAWIEFGSQILNKIWSFYTAADEETLQARAKDLHGMLARVENELGSEGPYFAGKHFTLVDAVYGPIFRYFDVIDTIDDFGVFDGLSRVVAWREILAKRPSIQKAVAEDYPERLKDFFISRNSALSARIAA
ncbi:MAG: glutathione S-transferase family protein [Sphingomonadales bacterium]|jgi:glutathione S-transferase